MNKYIDASQNTKWVAVLPQLLKNYNTSPSRAIGGRSPIEMINHPSLTPMVDRIAKQTETASKQSWAKEKILVGSTVRTRLPNETFRKGTQPRWSAETHVVTSIVGGVWYYLDDDRDTKWLKYELLLVDQPPQTMPVNHDEKYDDDSGDDEKADDDESYDPLVEERREKQVNRRLDSEGMRPYRFSGDPTNSLEQRFQDSLQDLEPRRKRRRQEYSGMGSGL